MLNLPCLALCAHVCIPARKEIKSGSVLGKRIKSLNDAGKLVDDATIVEMARARIAEEGPHGGFILDGFPRTVPQAEMLDKLIKLDGVIDLVLRQDILVLKACSRRVCRACGEGYNLANIQNGDMVMPPLLPKKEGICDKVGGFCFHLSARRSPLTLFASQASANQCLLLGIFLYAAFCLTLAFPPLL